MDEVIGNQEKLEQVINPAERARFWAKKGVPFAVESFLKYADLTQEESDLLLVESYEQAARIKSNIADSQTRQRAHMGQREVSLFNTSDDLELRQAIDAFASGNGHEGGADVFLKHTLSTLQRKISGIDREAYLHAQAYTNLADFTKQRLEMSKAIK